MAEHGDADREVPELKLFACTTVGGTTHLAEWAGAVGRLHPLRTVVARDLSRNEPIPEGLRLEVVNHDSGKKWVDYAHRKDDWGISKSLVNGVRLLLRHFLKSSCTHFLHLDSDQILDGEAIRRIGFLNWDYMQFTMVALPSDRNREHRPDWPRFLERFWESMCFGLSRRLARKAFKDLSGFALNPRTPDIQVHEILRKHFNSFKNGSKLLVETPDLIHYIEGVAVTLTMEAVIKRWRGLIRDNRKSGRKWFFGLPYRWWWGMSEEKFYRDIPRHLSKTEPDWFTENQLKALRRTRPKWFASTSFLIIVDVYGWAWDIASRELLKSMPGVRGRILSAEDFNAGSVNPADYDVALVYPWADSALLNRFNPRNTVICMAGGEQLDLMPSFNSNCRRFRFYGACNRKILATLRKIYPKKKVFLLSHGVDTSLFKPVSRKNRKSFVVGWVGRRERPLKRFDLAKKIADKAGVKLAVAGYKSRPHKKMPRFYNAIDCLLVTSVTEAHPLVVYEAMSCGLPVVTTRVGDVEQFIISGKNGYVLHVNAPVQRFVNTLNALKKRPELRERMGREARRTVLQRLTWKNAAKQYRALTKLVR